MAFEERMLTKRGMVYFCAVVAVAETFLWPATEGEPSDAFCDNLPDVARLTLRQDAHLPRAFPGQGSSLQLSG
jgi:hypothetical protein